MSAKPISDNIDPETVAGFSQEWAAFDQHDLPPDEQVRLFSEYFSEFPWGELPQDAEGFDLGCGSGLRDVVRVKSNGRPA